MNNVPNGQYIMSTKTTKGLATRQRVIESTREVINLRGYSNTSISDIISHSGVKKGNLYFHFPNKEDLLYEILIQAQKDYNNYLHNNIQGNSTLEKLKSLTAAVYSFHEKRGFHGGCIFGNTALEMNNINTRFTALIHDIFEEWISYIAHIIKEGIVRGDFSTRVKPEKLARHIVAVLEGGVMMSGLTKNGTCFKDCLESLHTYLEEQS